MLLLSYLIVAIACIAIVGGSGEGIVFGTIVVLVMSYVITALAIVIVAIHFFFQ
ncbi:MAG TPA: hypothetical protein PL154_03490 [Candidatus Woesebacteria bacterium]|nr:hypothetical protein [Candidatus Woesebacteria bacterium]